MSSRCNIVLASPTKNCFLRPWVWKVDTWYGHWLGCVAVHHGVTFNLGSDKVCSSAIVQTSFSYDKDIWIAAADYCMNFYIIVLFPLTAILRLRNFTAS